LEHFGCQLPIADGSDRKSATWHLSAEFTKTESTKQISQIANWQL
jgi:hypothetical protein